MNIEELLKQGENSAVEFKTAETRPESLAKEMVAFANTGGGTILVGVNDQGEVTGIPDPKGFVEWVANIGRNNVIPPIDCDIQLVSHQQKRVGVIDIPKGKDRPYQTQQSQYLIRIGSTNRVASVQELLRLFQQSGAFHFDAVPVVGSAFSDLNQSALEKYFLQYDVEFSREDDKERLLGNIDVMKSGELTVAGLLVFGIYPQRHMPNSSISYAHFNGLSSDEELIDKQVIDGALPEQIEKALAIIKHNIKQPSFIIGAKTQASQPGYPDKVFRELIVNAVTHRNYSISGSRIRIMHYEDRIEFISPGRLPNTVTVEKLRYGVSYATNPVILKFLENMRYVDKLGRGLPMVYQQAQNLQKQVQFSEVGEEFKVVLGL